MKTPRFTPLILCVLIFLVSCGDDDVTTNRNQNYPDDQFITTWKTDNISDHSSGPKSITISTNADYDYNYDVDWNNDGVFDDIGLTGDVTHDFGNAGTYTIRIRGEFPSFYFDYYPRGVGGENEEPTADNYKLISIDQWGTQKWRKLKFSLCANLRIKAQDIPDLSGIFNMVEMFKGAALFNDPVGHWDISSVNRMDGMFDGAESFNQPIGNWRVGNVTIMSRMFQNARSFDQPLDDWDVSKVTSMVSMFSGASAFNQPIEGWNVSKVSNMAFMFSGASSFNQPLENWDVSQVTTMSMMFSGARTFNQPLNWDVSNVADMSNMFWYASTFNQPIGNWDVGAVTSMSAMFTEATSFDQPLGSWNVSNVSNMKIMFEGATSFSQENYDNLLTGWSAQALQHDVEFDVDTRYCSDAATVARAKLIEEFGWIINDLGRCD